MMITVRGLTKDFSSFHALKGIDLNVKQGEIYGFIGHNGAGKSTTMNILAGLSRFDAGTCTVAGRDLKKARRPDALDMGYLPEDPRFYPWMTARETLTYLGNGLRDGKLNARVDEMLCWVGLEEAAGRRVGGFSRGMKQRLGIAAALMHDPSLLILDEPSSALDPEGRSDVIRLIRELKQMGKTVFFSTHILSDVERICDTVGIIADGRMVMEKPLEAMTREHILPIFDVETAIAPSTEMVERLKAVHGVTQVQARPSGLSVTVKEPDIISPVLMGFLAGENLPVTSFALRKPTLEDIFIKEANGHAA